MTLNRYKLSPSDFAFLYEGCKRCYYLKVVRGIFQPSIPLPAIFSKQWVRSAAIGGPSGKAECFINGRFDIVVEFDDRTYGVIDFKTGSPREGSSSLYGRQLHAYAYALEHPAPGALGLSPVTRLGLLYFYPTEVSQESVERLSYNAQIKWIEVKRQDQEFLSFMQDVMRLLSSPDLPEPSPDCQWCKYLDRLEDLEDKGQKGVEEAWKKGKLL
jgi:hypothetical protein